MDDIWLEVDCPACGIDYDLEIVIPVGEPIVCACGHEFTREELASGVVFERYEELDKVHLLPNPWASR